MSGLELIITRYTLVSALGRGAKAQLKALRANASGLRMRLLAGGLPVALGEVCGLEDVIIPAHLSRYDCRNNRIAALALETDGLAEAVAQCVRSFGADRIGLVVGTSTSGIAQTEAAYRDSEFGQTGALRGDFPYRETHNVFSCADFTRRYLGLKGPAFVISTACSSSAKAFGTAARLLRSGSCRAVVVGGVDSLCDTTLYGFQSLGLLAKKGPKPFSADRDGIGIGEAAGFAIVMAAEDAQTGLYVAGIGDSADAYHMTAPHPEALGARAAMGGALTQAGWTASQLDYIHLHGTGTIHNDAVEDLAIRQLDCAAIPASSTKGAIGHTLGAAGICGVVLTAECMRGEWIAGTTSTEARDPLLGCNLVLSGRPGRINRALINTFGFGGSNCCLALEWRP